MTDDGTDSGFDTTADNRCVGERGRSGRILTTCSAGQTTSSENVPIRAIWLTGSPFSLTRAEPSCICQRGESLWPMHSTVRPEEQ